MAVVDLRNADIFLRDGTDLTITGAVNNVGGYTSTTTTMIVDGFVGIVAVGQGFYIQGTTTTYTVTAHTETSGNTTSITFTPGLAANVNDDDVIVLCGMVNNVGGYPIGATTMTVDGIVGALVSGSGFTINGGAEYYNIISHTESSGNTVSITFSPPLVTSIADDSYISVFGKVVEVKVGEGTLTYSEKRAVTYVLNRGKIYTVKLGDDAPVEVSFDFIWEFLRSTTGNPPTVEEALKQIGQASTWVSSSSDPCEPYSVDVVICYVPPCGDSETIILDDFRHESLDHDLKAGQVSVKGNCNIPYATVNHFSA